MSTTNSWSKFKAKVLRRSSTVKAATGAEPFLVPNSSTANTNSLSPVPLRSPLTSDKGFAQPRSCNSVSSLSTAQRSISDDTSVPPASPSAERGRYYGSVDEGSVGKSQSPREEEPSRLRKKTRAPGPLNQNPLTPTLGSQERQLSESNLDRVRAVIDRHSLPPDFLKSPPRLLGSNELLQQLPFASTATSPLPTSGSGTSQTAYNQGRDRTGSTVGEPQLPTPLTAVAENPSAAPYNQAPISSTVSIPKRPSLGSRRQSLFAPSHQHLISDLLEQPRTSLENDSSGRLATGTAGMLQRKIWVRRPGGSATLVPTAHDALVDELRDQVIMKYANSLGKTFDAPDIVIRIAAREGSNKQATPDRMLSPEEPLVTVVDSYFPGGQTIEEALIIDIPPRRTPKPSPRHSIYYEQTEPGEHNEYFPLMPIHPNIPTPPAHASNSSGSASAHPAPSISILTTGMAPPLPSPGSRGNRHTRRPPLTRHTTNSPTVLGQSASSKDAGAQQTAIPPQPAPQVPTPPVPPPESPQNKSMTPPARGASPRPRQSAKPKKSPAQSLSAAFGGLIEGTVPPINVLIVEDNVINQRLLEAFMKRLSVRWKCAANGEEAVKRWREGGFHLVLMDIQLPVMNGLDATKEIRRLERLNGIGVFPKTASGRSSAASTTAMTPPEIDPETHDSLKEEDVLHDLSLFKSPVIIVALTASSLQSDRHEALAAGCNDFLTKPVRFEWLEQKVTEWGCMQALIDFEGWRKWRGYANDNQSSATPARAQLENGRVTKKYSPALPDSSFQDTAARLLHLPKPSDLLPEDSSGGEAPDSPASPLTTVPVGETSSHHDAAPDAV
ncbi:response regulator [Aspergillus bombycis]|uniref:Response regulator n=1 Tax=Aspergillus bombycis TaxID=109264 RepID=A0A1F8A7N8_9EURO|nr:response regulator [Aspergillus bombycis]OGM47308.1 response regulator [Aspergillus bombycis]